jgi:hypothetical protein
MTRLLNTDSNSLTRHGVAIIIIGTTVCALGSVMSRPAREDLGYVLAVALTAMCLLITLLSLGSRHQWMPQRRLVPAYLAGGASLIACYIISWLIQPGLIDIRLIGVLAGLLGLVWGSWYMKLAFHFQSNSFQAGTMSVLAVATSSLGIVLAIRAGSSKITAVVSVGCYMIILGAQVYLTAAYLQRELMRERALERS